MYKVSPRTRHSHLRIQKYNNYDLAQDWSQVVQGIGHLQVPLRRRSQSRFRARDKREPPAALSPDRRAGRGKAHRDGSSTELTPAARKTAGFLRRTHRKPGDVRFFRAGFCGRAQSSSCAASLWPLSERAKIFGKL